MQRSVKLKTVGRRLLGRVLKKHTEVQVANATGVKQPSVSAWKLGHSKPDRERRDLLELHFGIPSRAWLSAKERREADRLRLRTSIKSSGATAPNEGG